MLFAFFWGVIECRSDFTRHYGPDLIEAYDTGRALGRRILTMED